jgi:clan AA aspartic protease (TIGR02281 family)
MRSFHLPSMGIVVVCLFASLLAPIEPARADEAAAKASLTAKGIRASHAGLSLQTETEFTKAVPLAYTLRRKFQSTLGQQQSAGSNNEQADAEIQQLMEQNETLRKQMPQGGQPFVPFQGQISQGLRAEITQKIKQNEEEIASIQEARKQSTKSSAELRQEADSARTTYFQQVRDARALADKITGQYAELNKDQEVLAAIKEWNDAAKTSATLKPSRSFESAVKRLEALEKKIVSEKIPLRNDGKNFLASVEINGKQTCDMIVDTSAATLMLPYQMALDAGAHVDATSVPSDLGSKSEVKQVTLSSVRVGSITAKNVACGVYPAKMKAAKAVLGLSFLGQYKYEINAPASELSLVRVDAEATTGHRKKKTTTKHIAKKSVRHKPAEEQPQEQPQE